MDALERLVAIQEIRDQIARYAIFFDDKNWDDFAELWADDAAFVGPGLAFDEKHAVLVELIEPGRARARTDVVWITMAFETQIVARYDDIFRLVDGRWLFERRTEVVVPYRAGGPPMSEAAMVVSSSTMRPLSTSESGTSQ